VVALEALGGDGAQLWESQLFGVVRELVALTLDDPLCGGGQLTRWKDTGVRIARPKVE
jgi:hypothetical protein